MRFLAKGNARPQGRATRPPMGAVGRCPAVPGEVSKGEKQ